MSLQAVRINHIIFSFFLSTILLIGCSKESKNPIEPVQEVSYLWIHFANDSTKIEFDNLPKIDADGEEAIQLSSFIDTTIIPIFRDKDNNPYDARVLYAYKIVGDDGFSASKKGYPDNIWDHLKLGHILTQTRQVVFPDDKIDLAGAYNVKQARHIYIFQKFDVDTPDTTAFVELQNLTSVTVTNPDGIIEKAIQLKDFILIFIATPEIYHYNMLTLDNFGPTSDMTWDQFQTGYWLLTSQKTMFTGPDLDSGRYKLKVLEKILVK